MLGNPKPTMRVEAQLYKEIQIKRSNSTVLVIKYKIEIKSTSYFCFITKNNRNKCQCKLLRCLNACYELPRWKANKVTAMPFTYAIKTTPSRHASALLFYSHRILCRLFIDLKKNKRAICEIIFFPVYESKNIIFIGKVFKKILKYHLNWRWKLGLFVISQLTRCFPYTLC